jgi:hypothetical protein
MDLYQQVQLEQKLEELLFSGSVSIGWQQIYCWYKVEKITKAPWRDIQQRWETICESNGIEAPSITVRGIKGGSGNAHLSRPFIEKYDATEVSLEDLI